MAEALAGMPCTSAHEWIAKSGYELDEISLAARAGLVEQAAQMGPDRSLRNAESLCDFGNAADVHDGEQNTQLGRRQTEGFRDECRQSRRLHLHLANEQGGDGTADDAGAAVLVRR